MMNASAAPTAQPAPTTTITSLTSKNNNNNSGTTTSMSEALAKSVGDIICDKNKNNSQKRGSAKITPTSPSSNNTAAENTNGGRVKNSQIRVVSAEHSNNGKSSQQSSTSNNMSSMSSAVADLASGMPNFTPTSSNTNNNTNNSSAPIIISGTAAAVLALQSPFSNNSVENINNSTTSSSQIIVSNSSSSATTWNDNIESSGGENRGGKSNNNANNSSSSSATVPNPLLQGAAVSSPSNSPTETQSDYPLLTKSSSTPSQHSPLTRTRYADGGPIIAGTAAAQMEAIATATAARITSITTQNNLQEEGGGGDDVINAVASLGSPPEKGGGGAVVVQQSSSNHGFNVGQHNNNNNDSSSRYWDHHGNGVKTSISMRSGGNTLFSVDHGSKGGNNDDDDEIMSDLPPQTPKGGMDILAELTCHALPMALPGQHSYPQHYEHNNAQIASSSSLSIPSYQEIYQDQGSHQNHHHAQHHQAQHHDATMSPDGTKRVSGIPSYQEIYREMGLSPQQSTSPEQRRRHNHHHTNNSSSYSYSVEEVSIDGSHRYNNVYHHHQQQNIPPTSTPHRTTTHFGHVLQQHRSSNDDDSDLLEEGKEIYTRKDICVLGGHCSEVKEVHGNMREGCDSLVIGSLEKDIREADGLLWFLYSTDRTNGGGALCQSYHKKRPVRVFRSSLLGNKYAPPYFDVEDDLEEDSDVAYRYDGLYMVRAVWDIHGRETESHPVAGENGWQTFFCIRIPKKPLEKEKWEEGMQYNTVGCQELWSSIQKMRGVRKPKKFEIPTPPVKLLTLNKCAISGQYKDRKCPGYVKPDVVEVPPPVETTKKSNNNNRSVSGTKRRRKGQQHREEESDESDENETNQADEDESDSDSSERHHSSSPASSKRSSSPAKVMTPRPRLNSVSQKKASVSTNNDDDDADSSDSETSTSANNTSMNKKRARSPSRKVILNNNLDVSAYFPKRASAAKAEAANRHMFGSRSYKRKSSESAASSSTTTAAKAKSTKQQKPLRGAGGRKRIKVVPQDDDEFSSSSEEPNPDLIDHSILTVGSRVLVMYKDSFFKATIRKRREKDGKHDFLIHYDGNKKTNVHWITVDKISKILEINVDTPPKKKQNEPVKKVGKKFGGAKRRGNNGGGRRKAPAKQTSIDSHESVSSSGKPPALSRQQSLQRSHYPDEDDGSNDGKVPLNDAHDSDESENEEEPKSESKADADQKKNRVRDDGEVEESSDSEPDEPPKRKPSNIKTTTVATAASRKPRKTVVSEVCIAKERKPSAKKAKTNATSSPRKDPLLTLAEEAASDVDSDESSTNSSDKNKKEAQAESESAEEFKYPVGGHVYVEYRHILYSSNILKAKRKRSVTEYLVHYEGYKKSSNRWVKEKDVHEVNAAMTRRYEEQRLIPADILHESELPDFSITTRRKKATDSETQSLDSTNRSAATARKKPPPRRMRSDASDVALEALASGVSFLAGSMVFVEWSGALYLAKMVKKRYSGDRMEYLISYDGYKSSHDAWVSINKIYEVNPQTKRVFKRINADISGGAAGDGKPKRRVPPGRRETRKKAQDDEATSSSSRNSEYNKPLSRASSHASSQSSRKAPPRTSSTIDMKGIEPGVEFLPGSTLFAEYKGGLCLAKMLKKRGKDDYMEYFIQYHGLKKTEEAWISTSMVYEINPQTKRMHRLLSEKK